MMTGATTTHYSPEYLAEYNGDILLGTAITFMVVETVVMMLMVLSRYFAHGERTNYSMEVFLTMTYLVCMGKVTTAILAVKIGGAGHHAAALPTSTLSTTLKLSLVTQILCPMTTSLSKLGVLCFFHRVFSRAGRWYKTLIQATFVLVLMTMIAQVLIPFLNCRPFRKMWDPATPGTCSIPSLSLWRFLGIPNVLSTIIVIAIPVPQLATLHVSRPVKLGLCAVFAVCILGIVAAIMRFQTMLAVTDFRDQTFNVKPQCWIVAESGIYLVAGVMLTLRPLIRKIFKNTRLERWMSGGSSHSASLSDRRFGRWHRRERNVRPVVEESKQDSREGGERIDMMGGGIDLVRTKSSKDTMDR